MEKVLNSLPGEQPGISILAKWPDNEKVSREFEVENRLCMKLKTDSKQTLTRINLYALDSFDIVCDRNGLQMATYLWSLQFKDGIVY